MKMSFKKVMFMFGVFLALLFFLFGCGRGDDSHSATAGVKSGALKNTTEENPAQTVTFTIKELPDIAVDMREIDGLSQEWRLGEYKLSSVLTFSEGVYFDRDIICTDDFGNEYNFSLTDWFENSAYVDVTLVNDVLIRCVVISNVLIEYSFPGNDAYYIVGYLVDGVIYDFVFTAGRKFVTEKTDTGYKLLPEQTLLINKSPGINNINFWRIVL